MKKLKSTWYNMAIVLTAIAVVAGAALGYVNDITKGPIEAIKAQQLADGIGEVIEKGDRSLAGKTLAAKGLTLEEVYFDESSVR